MWSLLNVFSAVRMNFERWRGWEWSDTLQMLFWTSSSPELLQLGQLELFSFFYFLSLCLLCPVCQAFKSCRDVNRVHGGPPLYILKSQFTLGTSSVPLPPILWRSKELLHKTAIGPSAQSGIINIYVPSVRAQRLLSHTLSLL